ncbi:MAG: hypothetical protein QM718_09235 [Steroidobacteraceae bacterium]
MSYRKSPPTILAMASMLGLVLTLQAGSALAGERTRTRTVTVQRTASGHTRDTTVTNAAGQTATRDATVTKDAATGTRTRDVQYTGYHGKSASVESVKQRTANGYTNTTTATGPNGGTATRNADVSCDKASQSCTKNVSITGGKPAP